jgi:hypothetical protein
MDDYNEVKYGRHDRSRSNKLSNSQNTRLKYALSHAWHVEDTASQRWDATVHIQRGRN